VARIRGRCSVAMKVVALLCTLCAAAAAADKSPSKHDDQATAAPQLQYVSWG
jgi:hypothetical protein